MPIGRWFAKSLGSASRRSPRRRDRARLGLEDLECRTVPSAFTEEESNDAPATANAVTPGTGDVLTTAASDWLTINGTVSGGAAASDYFRFTLAARSGVFFDIDSLETGLSSTFDSFLTLFDSSGTTQIAANDDGYDFEGFAAPGSSTGNGTSRDSSVYADLAPGTYFIRVNSFNGSTGAYQLRVLADSNYDTTVPVLNSRPGAADTLYLDFDGHAASDGWGTYAAGAFDFSGNAAEFSPAERLAIRNIWSVVTEDFSPFNINVSTVQPASFANGVGFRQVVTNSVPSIVGQSDTLLGVGLVDSYVTGGDDNVAFTFANNFGTYNGGISGRIMAAALEQGNTSSHEFGHALGLEHYASTTGGSGPASALPDAIMATPDAGLNRELWAAGINEEGNAQVDLDVLAGAVNTIGYAPDDHGDAPATATSLVAAGNSYSAASVIHATSDADVFRFTANGPTMIRVDVNEYVNNLDVVVRLLDSAGTQIAVADPSGGFDAAITQTLPSGTYYVVVLSNGEVGEVGQYTLQISTTGNLPPLASDPSLGTDEDSDVVGTLPATDPNGDALTYSIVSGPSNGTLISFDPTTGAFVYRPNPDYFNTSATPDTFTFRASDGSLDSNLAAVSITVGAVNDAPSLTPSGGPEPFTENGPAVAIDPDLTVSDVDSGNLTGATVQITGGYVGGQDVLAFTGAGGITGFFDPSTGTLTLSGSATLADYQSALRSVTFANTSDDPDTGFRTVTFVATDGSAPSAPVTRTIGVTATNDAPVVTTSSGPVSYAENGLPVTVDSSLTVSDPEDAVLTGATVQITGGYVGGQDVLAFTLTDAAGITGYIDVSSGVLVFSGAATVAAYQFVLRSVTYFNTGDAPGASSRAITFAVFDGNTTSAGATRTVLVTAINDAPVIALPSDPIVAFEDTPRTIGGIGVGDPDAGTGTVTVTLSVTHGVLTVVPTGGLTVGQVSGNGTRSVTLAGTLAAVNATLADGVRYAPDADYNGPDALTATANDQGSGGPALFDTRQVAIDVREVNDAPVVFDDGLPEVAEDSGTLSIPFASLIGNDAGGPADESGQALTVVSVGDAVGGTVTLSDGVVLFTPAPDFNGTASFTYTVQDGGTTGGSFEPGTATATAFFTVTSVDDAPPPAPVPKDPAFAIGLGAGLPAFAALFNADGSMRFVVNAIPGFFGGVSAAAGDVTGDGQADLIVAAVLGGFSVVEVFDGNTGGLVRLFFALPTFGTVARVGASDANGDGFADIFVGPFYNLPIFGVFSGRDQSFLGLAGGVFLG